MNSCVPSSLSSSARAIGGWARITRSTSSGNLMSGPVQPPIALAALRVIGPAPESTTYVVQEVAFWFAIATCHNAELIGHALSRTSKGSVLILRQAYIAADQRGADPDALSWPAT